MTTVDDKVVPKVFDALEKIGTDMVFTLQNRTNSPTTGSATKAPVPFTRKAAPMFESDKWKGGTLEDGPVSQTVIAAQGLAFTPEKGMLVKDTARTYVVSEINTVSSGDQVAAYELMLDGQG